MKPWLIASTLMMMFRSPSLMAEAGAGCVDTRWWATEPLRPVDPPVAAAAAVSPIDTFVQAELAAHGLTPAPPADRRTLIRRIYFDLTGLPPTLEEVEDFVSDPNPRAVEALVDRLLASPRYGEHWARHWLDSAGYADTHGNDHDYARPHAWPYRDYVIQSFNDDKPYVRFVQEQVAGDVLFQDDPQGTVALGFLAAGPWDHTLLSTVRDDTVDHQMGRVVDRDGLVTAVMGTFQSLTVQCARCHDHKFDPISQREYYQLQAVFAGVDRADRPYDPDPAIHAKRQALLARKHAMAVQSPALLAALNEPATAEKIRDFEQAMARRDDAWQQLIVTSMVSTGGATLARQPDGSWFADGPRPDKETYIVTAQLPVGALHALRLETLPDDRLPHRGPGRFDNGHFHLTEFRAFAAPAGSRAQATALVFGRATADQNEGPGMTAAQAIDGKSDTHWGIHPHYGAPHEAVFELKQAMPCTEGMTFTLLLEHHGAAPGHAIGRFRLSASFEDVSRTGVVPPPPEVTALLKIPAAERTESQRRDLALAVLGLLNSRALAALPAPRLVYAVTRDFVPEGNFKPSLTPRPIHVLARGELLNPREAVEPGALSCLPGLPATLSIPDSGEESHRRAALARWLTDERNSLTWRSIVNRVWHHHFGRGLCATPNDFGAKGDPPSHPALLDWLAAWFRDDARGSMKALHRLILNSATYRQSVTHSPPAAERDPGNRLLWRMNRQRLTGEQIRDALLQSSGQLDLTMGGPAVVQFVSRGDATFNPGGNPAFLDYENFSPDAPENRRRSIYRFVFRTVPDPFMDALDCPDGSAATPVRGSTTTPVQAFAMLNDAFLIRQCEHVAARLENEFPITHPDDPARLPNLIQRAFRLLLLREPRPEEIDAFTLYVRHYGLANACHTLVNTSEFVYLD
ncbi:MAG: DUF1549 and DUF1553 domain-containing protein [Verrucomicrobiales bacterium]